MDIIDAHHHLWDMHRLHYPWLMDPDGQGIFGSYEAIRRDYLPDEYLHAPKKYRLLKSVHIEADHDPGDPVAETRWLQSVADDPSSGGFPHAIVAHADFTRGDVADVLAAHCEYRNVRGIRQIANFHEDARLTYTDHNMLEDPAWRKGIGRLKDFNLSFDFQVYYQQMAAAAEIAGENPDVLFILDHTGMPVERDEAGIAGWRRGMKTLGDCANVAVKISGLGMCDPRWSKESIKPFVLETIETFGVHRCMFASNFPVDRLFSDFDTLYDAYSEIVNDFSEADRVALFRENAARFYRL